MSTTIRPRLLTLAATVFLAATSLTAASASDIAATSPAQSATALPGVGSAATCTGAKVPGPLGY